jgi:hypothetical protein
MGNRSIHRDVKIAAINLDEQNILTLKQILACVGFSRRTFYGAGHLVTAGCTARKFILQSSLAFL